MNRPTFQAGVLITCDVPTREFILHLNDTHQFVLERVDDTHLLIDARFVVVVWIRAGIRLFQQV